MDIFSHHSTNNYPEPLLQPDPHDGCILYSVAYICHCLGYVDTTPELVRSFRLRTHKLECMFPEEYGAQIKRHWHYSNTDEEEWQRYWLGQATRSWVEQHLAQGYIGLVIVERVPGKAHALVALESRGDDGIFVMDPLYGHRIETWAWFLSVGPGHHGCHHIDGWYRLNKSQPTN